MHILTWFFYLSCHFGLALFIHVLTCFISSATLRVVSAYFTHAHHHVWKHPGGKLLLRDLFPPFCLHFAPVPRHGDDKNQYC